MSDIEVPARRDRPEALTRLLREVGPAWGKNHRAIGDRMKAVYGEALATVDSSGIEVVRDQAYGPHARHRLDVYRRPSTQGAPVVVFVHGGAFVRGDKDISPRIYSNVLTWFARQGCVGINVEYRLAPESTFPGGAQDLALALDWTAVHAARHGGDSKRIFVMGHSAGGTHAASYAFDPAPGFGGRHLRGLVLVSARLRADLLPENPNAAGVQAYFGSDPQVLEQASPVQHAGSSPLPTMIVNAEFENPLLDLYGLEFAHRVAVARRRAPRYLQMADHNHVSIVAHFGTQEVSLGADILDFIGRTVQCTTPSISGMAGISTP